MRTGNASTSLSPVEQVMAESEGRWPRICALCNWLGQQSEVRYVL